MYKTIINKAYKSQYSQQQYGSRQMIDDSSKLNEKIAEGRELLLAGNIDAGDYRIIKNSSKEQIYRLEARLSKMATKSTSTNSIEKLLDKAINTPSHIDERYIQADIDKKRGLLVRYF